MLSKIGTVQTDDRQTLRQTDIQTGRQTGRHTERQADIETYRQTDRQTDRHAVVRITAHSRMVMTIALSGQTLCACLAYFPSTRVVTAIICVCLLSL